MKITNGSSDAVDMSGTTVNVTTGADGTPAEQVFDDKAKSIETKVAPGRTVTGTYGYAVNKADRGLISVEVSPGFGYESSLFSGAIR